MDHYLVPWHFPVYIEPSASFLLSLPNLLYTIRNELPEYISLLIDYDWLTTTDRQTDRQTDSTVISYLREVVPFHTSSSIVV